MNQADKEYLQKKGLLRKDETAVDWAIQEAAMKESVIFAGSLLEKGNGVMELQTISLYLDELAAKRHFMHVHLYVQHVFRNCKQHNDNERDRTQKNLCHHIAPRCW